MKRFFLSIMALCLCAVMSFAEVVISHSQLPYSEGFEKVGNTVSTAALNNTATYINYYQKATMPEGWGSYNKGGGSVATATTTFSNRQYWPYVVTNGSTTNATTINYGKSGTANTTFKYAASGVNSLKLQGYNPSTTTASYQAYIGPAWAVMPKFDTDVTMSKLVVTGKAKIANTSTFIISVGVMTDPTDLSTFVELGTFGPGKGLTSAYDPIEFDVPLKDYTGTGRYVAFRTPLAPSTATAIAYLDDIYVYEYTCDAPTPSIAGITDKTAAIAIDIEEGYFDIKIMEGVVAAKDVDATTAYSNSYFEGVEARPYYINDLQADKQYTAAVRMWCDDMSSKSIWKTITFKTLCTPATLDANKVYYETGFETSEGFTKGAGFALPCWEVGNASGGTGTTIPYVNGSTNSQGGVATNLYLYMSASSTYPMAYAVLPAITPENGDWSKVELSFKMTSSTTATNNRTVKIGIMNNPLDPASFVEITEVSMDAPAKVADGWTKLVATFENKPAKATGNCIALMLNTTVASTLYIDDLSIHALADCAAPNTLEMTSVGKDTCSIMWNGKAEKQYLVKWATEKVADEDKAAYTNWVGSQVVTGPQADIKGLNPNTTYYFTIQTICDSEYSDYSAGMLAVRTECPESYEIPYFNDFNSETATGAGKRPSCWLGAYYTHTTGVFNKTSYPYVLATSTKAFGGTGYCLETMSSSTYATYAVAPKVQGDLNDLAVSFYATNYSANAGRHVHIGYVTDWSSDTAIVNTFKLLGSVELANSNTYNYYMFDMSALGVDIPEDVRLTLSADYRLDSLTSGSVDLLIDNFKIGLAPSCFAPEVEAGKSTVTTADISITPAKPENTQWQLSVMTQEVYERNSKNIDKVIANPDSTMLTIATSTNFTITGLESGSMYEVFARTLCSEEDTSDWTKTPTRVMTKYKDSYFFGFEDEEGYEILAGATSSYKIHPALTVGATNAYTTSYLAKPYQQANTTTSEYAMTGNAAMRLYNYYSYSSEGGSSSKSFYFGQYVIMPALDECSAQKRSIRFNYRQGYNYLLTYGTTPGKMMGQVTTPLTVLFGLVPKGTTTPTEENFTLLQELKPQDLTDKVCTAEEKFWETMIYNLTQDQALNYQVCIWWPEEKTTNSSWYVYLDNVQMTEAVNFEIPTLTSCVPTDVAVNVAWEDMTNAVNVYVYDEDDKKVGEALNITDNKAAVTGLKANTTYTVKVVDATAPAAMFKAAAVSRQITTECGALVVTNENPVLFTFDSDYGPAYPSSTVSSDANYLWPNCWTIVNNGTAGASTLKGYNWIIQRQGYSYMSSPTASTTYDNYNFGMKDAQGNATNSLRLNGTTTATYQTAYAALPRVKGNLNEYVLDFYFRPASLNMGTGKLASVSTEKKFYVVAMSDVNDLSTADTLYTVEYPVPDSIKTTTLAANDPEGLEYWREFVVPLCGAKADDRIAFVQAGDQACYLFIDNVQIRKQGANEIFIPNNLDAENITKESATLTWESCNIGASYLLTVLEGEDEILMDEPVNGLSYNLTGLDANTSYSFYVKAAKGEATSDESLKFSFNTACPTYGVDDFKFSFEADENPVPVREGAYSTLIKNSCWIYENLGSNQDYKTSSSTMYFPYNHKDVINATTGVKTNTFSHSGDYCLELYASRGTTSATPTALGRVITPEIENAAQIFSQKVLKFYYRAIYHNSQTLAATIASIGATYGRGVIVGVCSDPNDETTFQTLDTLYYTLNPTSADMSEDNDYAWMKGFVKLDQAVGNRIWMMPLLKDTVASVAAYGRMYIDDMSFSDPMPILTTAVNDATMGRVSAGDAYNAGDPVTVEATANYNYKFVDWSDGSTENPYTFIMPATDFTLTASFAPKAITVSELNGEGFANETAEGDVRWVLVPGASAETYRQIAGWTYSNAGTTTTWSTSFPYNRVGATTETGARYGHSLETNDYSLYLYSVAAGTTIKGYVATPEISDINTLVGKQIEFYMRAGYVSNAKTGTYSYTNATSSYARSVEVGTCSNPNDISTFHKVKTVWCKPVVSGVIADSANDYLWEKQAVAFKSIPNDDKYIYIMANNYLEDNTTQKACYAYIDDISFTVAQPVITVEANNPNYGTVTGSGSYDEGTEITITAEAKYNHEFVQWNDGNTDASRTITVDGDATYTAEFAISKFNAVDINETFEAEEGGVQRWTLLPGTTTVTYKATEAWTYGNIGTGSVGGSWPYNVTSTSITTKYSYEGTYAAKLYATGTTYCGYIVTPKIEDYETAFNEAQFSFYMKPTYTSSGKDYTSSNVGTTYAKTVIVGVATDPKDVSTFTPVDTITYNVPTFTGTSYTENPSADNNYNWQKVTVDLKNNIAPYIYIMASRVDATGKTYTYDNMYIDNISFIAPVTVTVETEDALKGSAVVVGDATVEAGQNVTIKAVPEDTYVFNAWKQGETVVSNDAEYTFALTKNETYTATFKKDTLTIQVTTEGNGTVNINGAGTEAKVEKYTSLTLNAVANQGYQFVQWSDGNQDNPRQVSATEDKIYTAEFAAASVKVLVYVDAESAGMGAVAATGEGPAVNMYYVGKTVTMTATANEGYVFVKWNDGNTDNPRQITASAEVTYYASFKRDKAVVRNGLTSGRYYTLCESQKLTEIEGAIFFQPESWDGSRLVLAEVEEVKAGYGYMFQATSDKVLAVLTGDAVAAPVDAQVAKNGMQGTAFSGITNLPEGNDYCGIMNNHLQYFGANNTMIAKRAYVIFSAIGDQKAPASARRISMTTSGSNVATMLDNVRFDDDEAAAKFIIDGQLIIMKGGKMYNAQGQEL